MKIANLTIAAAVAFGVMLASASAELLDGSSWSVQVIPTRPTAAKGVERFEDVLTFSRGRLSSRELRRKGIGPVSYSAKGTPDFLNWETPPVLRKRSKAQWDGVTKDGDLKGNLEWVTRDGRVLYFYLRGTKD